MKVAGIIIAVLGGLATAVLFLIWVLGFGFAGAALGNFIHILLVFALVTGLLFLGGLAMFFAGRKSNTQ